MRNLERDTRSVYIARYLRIAPEEVDGLLTGRNVPVYSQPEEFFPSLKPLAGEAENDIFGQKLEYDLTLTVDNPWFDVNEADRLWTLPISREYPSYDGNIDTLDGNTASVDGGVFGSVSTRQWDYTVKKVARKGHFTVIAAQRAEVTA